MICIRHGIHDSVADHRTGARGAGLKTQNDINYNFLMLYIYFYFIKSSNVYFNFFSTFKNYLYFKFIFSV